MTELGAATTTTVATRRVTGAITSLVILLILIWLVAIILHISPYTLDLLLAAFGLILLNRLLKIKVRTGALRAISSFFYNLSVAGVETIILVYVLGWVASIQKTPFPPQLYSLVPELVLGTLVSAALAYVIGQAAPKLPTVRQTGKPLLVREGTSQTLGATILSTLGNTVAIPMSLSKTISGYVLFSDILATIETPMGRKDIKLNSPIVVTGIPLSATKLSEGEVKRLCGRSSKQLVEDAKSVISSGSQPAFTQGTSVDLPFVHVKEDLAGSDVQVGPINVRTDNTGEHVSIGPFNFDQDEGRRKFPEHKGDDDENDWRWFAYTKTGANINSRNGTISAKWNGSSMSLRGNYMRLDVSGDSFEYDPYEIKTRSPLHALRITRTVISLETSKFALNVYPGRILVRTSDGKSRSTESSELAGDLREALTSLAMKQVKDLLSGEPIDVEEMLNKTERVLTQYA